MGNKFLALRKSEVAKVAPDRAALMGKVSQEMADMKTIREADRRWLCLMFREPYGAEFQSEGTGSAVHILSRSLSAKRGERMTYTNGLHSLIELKKQHPEYRTVLHSDQGSVYASKNYNDLLGTCGIIHSMSRAGTPTDNAAMESINGWIKSELFTDFHLQGENVQEEMEAYIKFFNEERPAYSLGYLTPKQYRETYATV